MSTDSASKRLPSIVRFDAFELDLERQELRRDGRALAIQPLPLKALLLLAREPDSIVARERFHEALWPSSDSTDVERSLNHTIRKLRQTLKDDPKQPRFVQTVPHRGYRFIGAVQDGSGTVERSPSHAPAVGEPLVVRVLAFEGMADDQSWSFLSGGLRQELISRLISLAGRSLVLVDEPAVSDDGASFLALKGSVQRTGTTVRIHAFLSAYRNGAGTFVAESTLQMELGNVFELQNTASQHIIESLILPRLPE